MPEDPDETIELARLQAGLEKVREAVLGHREWALRQGFSPEAADDMAVGLHDFMLEKFC